MQKSKRIGIKDKSSNSRVHVCKRAKDGQKDESSNSRVHVCKRAKEGQQDKSSNSRVHVCKRAKDGQKDKTAALHKTSALYIGWSNVHGSGTVVHVHRSTSE